MFHRIYKKLLEMSKKHASLRDYSDKELYEELQKNERLDSKYLTFICSEVLRRMVEKDEK